MSCSDELSMKIMYANNKGTEQLAHQYCELLFAVLKNINPKSTSLSF